MLQYCDYLANVVKKALVRNLAEVGGAAGCDGIVALVGYVASDLHPTEGWFQSTTKTIKVQDTNGQEYLITVEAVEK
jgi:hypothetical protein